MPLNRFNLIDGVRKAALQAGAPQQKKSQKIILRFFILLGIIAITFGANAIFLHDARIASVGKLYFWKAIGRLAIGQDKVLKGELEDRVTILVMGIGGNGHEGPLLADTFLLISIKPSTNQAAIISLPRDLYLNYDGKQYKLNALIAAKNDIEKGGEFAREVVQDVFNISTPYWIVVDFKTFEKIIDYFGGVEIAVERSFVDTEYPGPNFSYRTIAFEKGAQLFTGARALEFARSRHGSNGENGDFARIKRQQKIIIELLAKIKTKISLLSFDSLYELYRLIKGDITTNIDVSDAFVLAKFAHRISPNALITKTIEEKEKFLEASIISSGAYVLMPYGGNYSLISEEMKNVFNPQ
ncbi:MAG: LCP family protein [Parcubacteria group bacterium]|nr:LCP family protein [Parcubacteria group bacterium]